MQDIENMSTAFSDMPKDENEKSKFEESRKARLLELLMIAGGPVLYYFGISHIVNKNYLEGSFDLIVGVSVTAWFITLRRNKKSSIIQLASRYLMFLMSCLVLYFISIGCPGNSKVLWSYLYPLLAFFLFGKREGMIWISIFFLMTMIFVLFPDFPLIKSVYNQDFNLRFLVSLSLVGVMSFIFEVTRESSQTRMLTNQRLLKKSENRQRDAYERLKETQAQLVQSGKLASIGELASGVAHELNQPLMVIRATAQMTKRSQNK